MSALCVTGPSRGIIVGARAESLLAIEEYRPNRPENGVRERVPPVVGSTGVGPVQSYGDIPDARGEVSGRPETTDVAAAWPWVEVPGREESCRARFSSSLALASALALLTVLLFPPGIPTTVP
jgi:hypothetical protein